MSTTNAAPCSVTVMSNNKSSPRGGHVVSFSVVPADDDETTATKWADNTNSSDPKDSTAAAAAAAGGADGVSGWRFFMWFVLSVMAGFGMPLLRSYNLRVGEHLGSSYWSICLHYTAATVYTGLWSLVSRPPDRQSMKQVQTFVRSKVWNGVSLLAGLTGIVNHMLMVEAIKVTTIDGFYVSAVLGMMVGSLVLDYTGWLWTNRYGISWGSGFGAAILVTGFAVNYGLRRYELSAAPWHLGTMHLISFMYGLITLLQAALSSQLGRVLGHFRNSATWNYLSGIVFGYILALCLQPRPRFNHLAFTDLIILLLACFSVLYLVVGALAPRDVGFASVFGWIALGNFIGVYSFGPAEDAKQSVGLAIGALAACVGSFVLIFSWHIRTQADWLSTDNDDQDDAAAAKQDLEDYYRNDPAHLELQQSDDLKCSNHKSTDFSSGLGGAGGGGYALPGRGA